MYFLCPFSFENNSNVIVFKHTGIKISNNISGQVPSEEVAISRYGKINELVANLEEFQVCVLDNNEVS